jgi:putative transposase
MNWTGLKKIWSFGLSERRCLVEKEDTSMSMSRQCQTLGVSRGSLYYAPVGVSAEDMLIMRHLDEAYTRWPFYGVRRMRQVLMSQGFIVNPKRIRRLMRSMGLEAVYPKPRLGGTAPNGCVYPYLLKGIQVQRPNQVWASDITYIRMRSGFLYLFAILDWFSRYVISWELSNTADTSFCLCALRRALETACPEISNTDQGSQFTLDSWLGQIRGGLSL